MITNLPKEAIEFEDQWQLVQDHIEDRRWQEALYALDRLRHHQAAVCCMLLKKRRATKPLSNF